MNFLFKKNAPISIIGKFNTNTETPVGIPDKYSIISPIPPRPPDNSPAGTKNLTTANEHIKSPSII